MYICTVLCVTKNSVIFHPQSQQEVKESSVNKAQTQEVFHIKVTYWKVMGNFQNCVNYYCYFSPLSGNKYLNISFQWDKQD